MNFIRIDTTNHPLFAACRKIYCNNFPYQEQRSLKEQERVFKTYPNFHFMALTQGEEIVGIITYWRFINCYFAEHLAIGDQYKGNGYGSLPGGTTHKGRAYEPWRRTFWGGVGSSGGEHSNPIQYSCLENPHRQRSLMGYSPWGCKEWDTTERLTHTRIPKT